MSIVDHRELRIPLARLTVGMLALLDEEDSPYTEREVNRCREILSDYACSMDEVVDRLSAMEILKSTIIRLNHLNEGCGGALIGTSERDEICGYLSKTLELRGLGFATEEDLRWRQW
jgi:hypothetical protein